MKVSKIKKKEILSRRLDIRKSLSYLLILLQWLFFIGFFLSFFWCYDHNRISETLY